MGNKASTMNSSQLVEIVDNYATNYILTENFQDMVKLTDDTYCEKLTILVADKLADVTTKSDVEYLAERVKDGTPTKKMVDDELIYLPKSQLSHLSIQSEADKKSVCIGIAKFYIKIAHLFAAVVTTINPIYSYKSKGGESLQVSLLEKTEIPKDAAVGVLQEHGFCSQRLDALINGQNFNVSGREEVILKPNFCKINLDPQTQKNRTLMDEPGFPDLRELYKDVYDPSDGKFKSMSPQAKQQFTADLKTLYSAFTGNARLPADITNYNDITLKNFSSWKGCQEGGPYTKEQSGSLKENLFKQYVAHVRKMMNKTSKAQQQLISILKNIFVPKLVAAPTDINDIINPELTEEILDKMIVRTRGLIVKLYVTCETDFLKGIEIFEAIIEKIYLDTSISRISQLDSTIHEMAAPGEVEEAPEEPAADEQPEEPAPPITGEVREREEDVEEQSISDRRRNAARMNRRAREAAIRAYSQHPQGAPQQIPPPQPIAPPQGNPFAPPRFSFGSAQQLPSDRPFSMGKDLPPRSRRSRRSKAVPAGATQDMESSTSAGASAPESPTHEFKFTAPPTIATTQRAESDTSFGAAASSSPRFTFTNPP